MKGYLAGYFKPLTLLIIITVASITGLALNASMYSFHLMIWELQNQTVTGIQKQTNDFKTIIDTLYLDSVRQEQESKARADQSQFERDVLINQTLEIKKLVEAQGNLTINEREGLIDALIDHINDTTG